MAHLRQAPGEWISSAACASLARVSRKKRSLSDLFAATGETISDLSEVNGLSRASIHRWIAGKTTPHRFQHPAIAKALGVTEDEVRAAIAETKRRKEAGEEL